MKYEIKYWYAGNIEKVTIEAPNEVEARVKFLMFIPNDDIISVKKILD